MNASELSKAMAIPLKRAEVWADPLNAAFECYEIDEPICIAHFLAQIGHESGRLVHTRELWGPTAAQVTYERDFSAPWVRFVDGQRHRNTKPFDLGNSEAGDGFKFRGRGLIQVTGRANYRACGIALGVDLEVSPYLLELPEYAALSAAWYWKSRNLNALARRDDIRGITRVINGGMNGFADRQLLCQLAKTALGV